MNRTECQQLSTERIKDAEQLLATKQWSGAYYMMGYALECALKSCVLAFIEKTGIIFEEKKYSERCWTHDIDTLVELAGLKDDRDDQSKLNPKFGQNWAISKDWSEASRYQFYDQFDSDKLFKAITDENDGVLPWVKTYW